MHTGVVHPTHASPPAERWWPINGERRVACAASHRSAARPASRHEQAATGRCLGRSHRKPIGCHSRRWTALSSNQRTLRFPQSPRMRPRSSCDKNTISGCLKDGRVPSATAGVKRHLIAGELVHPGGRVEKPTKHVGSGIRLWEKFRLERRRHKKTGAPQRPQPPRPAPPNSIIKRKNREETNDTPPRRERPTAKGDARAMPGCRRTL